ncbi:hypothetical protein GHT06_020098 [Daphnia sinensis]|uniref:Uncharacterized protein n=1 Tax=Daphnia sinensis TaxID=1820382 RepID=A0AAD5PP69_9CRUS|nr:hypothetical protein GHT06_020098 [Daphnia sinensis]
MHQAEKESQKTVKMMEYQLYRNLMKQQRLAIRLKGLLMAAQKPVQTAEGQVTVLPERFGALKEIEMEASGVIESEKTDDVGSADLPQKNADFHAITSNEVVTEANGIVEAEKIEEMDSKDPKQKNADINKKKPGFKVKRWLQKRVFRQRKVTTV